MIQNKKKSSLQQVHFLINTPLSPTPTFFFLPSLSLFQPFLLPLSLLFFLPFSLFFPPSSKIVIAGYVPLKAFPRQTYLAIRAQCTRLSESSFVAKKFLKSLRCITFLRRRLLLAILRMREDNLAAPFHGDASKRRAKNASYAFKHGGSTGTATEYTEVKISKSC